MKKSNSEVNGRPPVISVIMPSLNVCKYIRQCVESVCNQTLKDLEILCIDAGSTDGTREILQEIADRDSRIRIIDSDKKSYGFQMNLGLEAARGQFIGIVETDDYIDADMYENLYRPVEKHNVDVVKANYYTNQEGKDAFTELFAGLPYRKVIHPKDRMSILTRRPAIWSGIYKKTFLDRNNIRFLETAGASYQDTSFILKVWIAAERIYLIKEAFLHYRLDNPNSSVNSKDKIFFVKDEFLAVHEYLDSRPVKKQIYDKTIWDCEANVYEWNYKRLSDELKYLFLSGIQERYQEGLKHDRYDRQFMRWTVWRMVLEVAEDPMIYLYQRLDRETWEKMAKEEHLSDELKNRCRKWVVKEKSMLIPQTMFDIVNYAKYYGMEYCIRWLSRRH